MNEKLVKEDSSGDDDVAQYRNLVGSLLYLTTIRPNIIYASGLCINRTRYILELQKECCGICQV
jgi:hypothetical protein